MLGVATKVRVSLYHPKCYRPTCFSDLPRLWSLYFIHFHHHPVGKAASINGLCITPKDFTEKLGEFAEYCPVSLALRSELVDCSKQRSLTFAVEYK